MRHWIRLATIAALSATALAVFAATPSAAGPLTYLENRIKHLHDQLIAQKAQISSLQSAVSALQASDAAQSAVIADLQSSVTALEQALANTCPPDQAPVCCPPGLAFCGEGCIDVLIDPMHCGECGNMCPSGYDCVSGECAVLCVETADCGSAGDACNGGICSCGGGSACANGACIGGECLPCGNGFVDPGEECDDGNLANGDGCDATCSIEQCAPNVIFAVGVFGTTTCDSRCASEGRVCIGIGTDDGATDGLFNDCGSSTSGVATQTSPGTCGTVLGGQGCSEFTNCRCAPTFEEFSTFAVGVFGTTTCESRCESEGGFCLGIGTDEGAMDGLFNDCGSSTSGVATQTSPGSCGTVLGGQGCSEFTNCRCRTPDPECTGAIFAVGVFGTTTCASRCQSEGGTCIGIGTDDAATDGLFNDCGSSTSGVATQQSPGTCGTVLGGQGCSEFTNCLCYFP